MRHAQVHPDRASGDPARSIARPRSLLPVTGTIGVGITGPCPGEASTDHHTCATTDRHRGPARRRAPGALHGAGWSDRRHTAAAASDLGRHWRSIRLTRSTGGTPWRRRGASRSGDSSFGSTHRADVRYRGGGAGHRIGGVTLSRSARWDGVGAAGASVAGGQPSTTRSRPRWRGGTRRRRERRQRAAEHVAAATQNVPGTRRPVARLPGQVVARISLVRRSRASDGSDGRAHLTDRSAWRSDRGGHRAAGPSGRARSALDDPLRASRDGCVTG